MKQTNKITRAMTAAQDIQADSLRRLGVLTYEPTPNQAVVYRLYTEANGNLAELTSRYFSGATLVFTSGLWEGKAELGTVIEIIGSATDLQSIVHLAGDIRQVNDQSSVLVTWNNVNLLNVTADV